MTPDTTRILSPHPATPAPIVRSLEATLRRLPHGDLSIRYLLRGDVARLRLPASGPAGRVEGLWEHTCFEMFIRAGEEAAYRELNFSPGGPWAAFDFSAYRQRRRDPEIAAALRIGFFQSAGRIEVDVLLPAAALPPEGAQGWAIALAAVLEAEDAIDGAHSYWALAHPAPRPDFHHPESFTLILSPATA